MLPFVLAVNTLIGAAFFVCNALQFFYAFLTLIRRPRAFPPAPKTKRYAILICARNEAAVIGHLLDSIRAQDYPEGYVVPFVMADNCDDSTPEVAAAHGAVVYQRHDSQRVGKGYALHSLLEQMGEETLRTFDACIVIDADNLLSRDYVAKMNDCFSTGRWRVFSSYRNAKNFGANWLASGSALCYLRESRQLHAARCLMNTNSGVNGTGFLLSTDFLLEQGGWNRFLLLEDLDFTMDCVTRGEPIGFCYDAILYDEQPVKLRQSWRQHIRWIRGYLQLMRHYGGRLIRGIFTGPMRLGCFDFLMSICPTYFITLAGLITSTALAVLLAVQGEWLLLLLSVGGLLLGAYGTAFMLALLTVITEWRRIRCPGWKKVLSVFTFPLYMFTFIPETAVSLFSPLRWKPIEHTDAVDLSDLDQRGGK